MNLLKRSPGYRLKATALISALSLLLLATTSSYAQQGRKVTRTQPGNSAKVYEQVDKMPEAPYNVSEYMAKNIVYPEAAKKKNIQGRVVIKFVVDKEGNVTSAQAVKSDNEILSKEALRVVNNMPKWAPGEKAGKPVAVYYHLPVVFKL